MKLVIKAGIVVVVVVVVIVGGVWAYYHFRKVVPVSVVTNQASHSNHQQGAPDGSIATVKAADINSLPTEFPQDLPAAPAGSVTVNQYSVDSSHVLHAEYKYTESNPSGTTVQQQYLKTLQNTLWTDIQSSGSMITATRGGYSLQVSFASASPIATTVDVTYALHPPAIKNPPPIK